MKDVVIIYDDDCGFCRWVIDRLLAWDRGERLRPVALQDEEALRLLPGMDEAQRSRSWHLVASDGHVWSAGRAVAPLLRLLPLGRVVAPVAETFPKTTQRLYQWGTEHRDQLGKVAGAKACSVDPKAHRRSTSR